MPRSQSWPPSAWSPTPQAVPPLKPTNAPKRSGRLSIAAMTHRKARDLSGRNDSRTGRDANEMAVDLSELLADLAAETESLTQRMCGASDTLWALQTPAAGWTIRDQF